MVGCCYIYTKLAKLKQLVSQNRQLVFEPFHFFFKELYFPTAVVSTGLHLVLQLPSAFFAEHQPGSLEELLQSAVVAAVREQAVEVLRVEDVPISLMVSLQPGIHSHDRIVSAHKRSAKVGQIPAPVWFCDGS